MQPLVVGLGHPDRTDDAVGHLVAQAVADARPDVAVDSLLDPLDLLSLMPGRGIVVLVDAAASGEAAGTVRVHDLTSAPVPEDAVGPAASSHGISVGQVVELARQVDAMPTRLLLVSIEVTDVSPGRPPTPSVRNAVPVAAQYVYGVLDSLSSASTG